MTLSACARNAPQDTLKPEGPIGRQIDSLFWPVFWIAVATFFIVEGALVFMVLRYRDRGGERTGPEQVHGNTRLEIAWTIVPALLLAGIAVPTVSTILDLAKKPTGDFLRVEVKAHQWWWEYNYPADGVTTANELHIPVGKPVYISLRSEDVIHSFWVPKLAGKQDVVPGRTNYLTIEASHPGRYQGQCTEYCGLSHANMRLLVVAESREDFEDWLSDQKKDSIPPGDALTLAGEQLFVNGPCAGCHTIRGTMAKGVTAPDLTHFAARSVFAGAMFQLDHENLIKWLRDPPALKPGSRMPNYHLSESDIAALVAYLETLQ